MLKAEKMRDENRIEIFEDKKVRTVWDESEEKWLISIIDVIEVLTESERPRKYWSDLKAKLEKEDYVEGQFRDDYQMAIFL